MKRFFCLALLLGGCAQSYGLTPIGTPLTTADGASYQLVGGGLPADQWGCVQVTGTGVIRTSSRGDSGIYGWAQSSSPSPGCVVAGGVVTLGAAAASGSVAGVVGGDVIGGSLESGLKAAVKR